MKYFISFCFILFSSFVVFSQSINLTGTVFDPQGSIVVKAHLRIVDEKNRALTSSTNDEGRFEIKTAPGIYLIEVSAPGFLTVNYREFLVVDAWGGKMTIDFVLFGAKHHEPCGYSGGDCLPAKALIKGYEVKHSPKLKEIRDEFAPVLKAPEKKPKN